MRARYIKKLDLVSGTNVADNQQAESLREIPFMLNHFKDGKGMYKGGFLQQMCSWLYVMGATYTCWYMWYFKLKAFCVMHNIDVDIYDFSLCQTAAAALAE